MPYSGSVFVDFLGRCLLVAACQLGEVDTNFMQAFFYTPIDVVQAVLSHIRMLGHV